MAAAGAESVCNGGSTPDDTLFLVGDPEEDRKATNKFVNKLLDTSTPVTQLLPCGCTNVRQQLAHDV